MLSTVYNDLVLIRLILHPDIVSNGRYIDEWSARVASFLESGADTYMMIHCPNNQHCPLLARDFHRALQSHCKSTAHADLPAWPVPEQHGLPL